MLFILLHILLVTGCAAHILLRRHRQPESRLAWLVVLVTLPYAGVIGYLLLGNTSIGRKRAARFRRVIQALPRPETAPGWDANNGRGGREGHAALFRVGQSISGYEAMGGNSAALMRDSDAAIDALVADIDAAQSSVHVLFYIWLADRNGTQVADALKRAALRDVACRAMVDDLGSRALIHGSQWRELAAAGVKLRRALQIGNPLVRILTGRIDLRNHRKIVVIDNRVTYSGSQNCADPAFLPKAKFGPWVDVLMRFEGPVARQNQHLFATDWMENGGDDISAVLSQPMPPARSGFVAQVIGTGPTYRNSAMPELFETLMYAAQRELFITTPYYVPSPGIQAGLCAAANRGVVTTIIFPARNDDFAVGATSRSHYESLLEAGVRVFEFLPGLLHAKSLTLDGEITLIGSANMDRRSFDLNYENNIMLHDKAITAAMRARQAEFQASSREVTAAEVALWSIAKRLWNNTLAIVGPVL